jgi:hypothetical protein
MGAQMSEEFASKPMAIVVTVLLPQPDFELSLKKA